MSNNKPVHELRLGYIKAAIWANETESGIRYNVKITRLYMEGETWKTTDSFSRDDLPLVAKIADLAHTWIFSESQDGIFSEPISSEKRNGRTSSRR